MTIKRKNTTWNYHESGPFRAFFLLLFVPFILSSCYKEIIIPEPEADLFELNVDVGQEQFIYSSRDTSYSIMRSNPSCFFNGQFMHLKEIRVRGQSALDFRRKSYAVFLNKPIYITDRYGNEIKELSRFKLISLANDYTYIENRISFGILEEVGIMPLFYKFVELKLNDGTQGIYMLIEDPEQYFKEIGSEFILRRGYNHAISDSEYEPSFHYKSLDSYKARYYEIYNLLTELEGDSLYTEISARLNIENYFRKIGIDYLIQNGDYTDEIYLYSEIEEDAIRYNIIPWDYDDIFDDKPHEIGITWGMGNLFGARYYETIQDVYDEVGETLIYSIEDDFDYTIARDSFLYNRYIETITALMETIDENLIDRIFTETENELRTFYESPAVISQSQYDTQFTNKERWQTNMMEKKALLKNRLSTIKLTLQIQKK